MCSHKGAVTLAEVALVEVVKAVAAVRVESMGLSMAVSPEGVASQVEAARGTVAAVTEQVGVAMA